MEEKVLAILQKIQPEYEFEDGTDFVEAGYLDSFAVIGLVAELEAEFNIRISPLEIVPENFSSLDNICTLIKKSTSDPA